MVQTNSCITEDRKVQQMFFKPAVSGEKSYILTEVEPFH